MKTFQPELAKIIKTREETDSVKTIRFRFLNKKIMRFHPGQFIMVTAFGVGEAPFGIVQTKKDNEYEFTFRIVGKVTSKLAELKKGNIIGIRGPFGNGFPLNKAKNKNVLLLAGGIGIPPIKSTLLKILEEREKYRRVIICYGIKSPDDFVYKKDFDSWIKRNDVEVYLSADRGNDKWGWHVGFVTDLIDELNLSKNTTCFICGPPIMMRVASQKLIRKGIKESNIYPSFERLMQCGVGKCGHCNIGSLYVCKDGPVIRLDRILKEVENAW